MKSSADWEAAWSASRSVLDLCPKTEKQCAALSLGMALLFLWKPNTLLFCFKRKCCPLNQFSSKFLQNHLFPPGDLHLRHSQRLRGFGLRPMLIIPEIDDVLVARRQFLYHLFQREQLRDLLILPLDADIHLSAPILFGSGQGEGHLRCTERLRRFRRFHP